MTREMVEMFCNDYYIPDEVHPVAPGRDKTITQFSEGKVDAKVFPIPVSLYVGGVLVKDPPPHLTARQEQTVRLLENNKAPFHRYPECFLCLVGLSPYYPFNENTYPVFKMPDGTEMSLLDFIKTADPQKVRMVKVQKKDNQVNLLESTSHCFMSLVTPAAGGSSYAAAPEVSAPVEVEPENVVLEDTYLDLTEPDVDQAMARLEEVTVTQAEKSKRKRLAKQSDALPAKQLRKDHPSLATGTGGKTLAGLRQLMPTSPLALGPFFRLISRPMLSFRGIYIFTFCLTSLLCVLLNSFFLFDSARTADVPVYTAAATVTSARENVGVTPTLDVAESSQLETSEGSDDSFYELPALNSAEAKRWYVPRWNITNDSLLDDGFSCHTLVDRVAPWLFSVIRSMDYEQLYTEFNVGAARQICLGSEEKDLEILKLRSLLAEEAKKAERAETAEVARLRDQVSVLTAEVSVLKSTVAQKDTDISLLDSRSTHLKSVLDDSQAACAKAGSLITSLTSERDRLTSEVSTLHTAFQDFKEKAEAQQEEQAQVLYNRVAELEAYVMDVSGHLEGEFYPAYLTTLAGKRWFLTHGIQLAVLKCLKSPDYQGILGHALGRAVDFGMQEGLEAGHEHRVVRTPLTAVEAYNPKAVKTSYFDAVRALEDVDFPLINLLKSKKDAGMDELSVPIHHSDDKAIVGETSLSFALLNVHSRAEGAKKYAAALRQLMMEIVSNPLSSQTWVGETSTFAAPFSVEDFD
ncbi:hypothetical protein Tco_0740490 [Tanacetum coccineum]